MPGSLYLMRELPPESRDSVARYVSDFTTSAAGLAGRLLRLAAEDVLVRPGVVVCDGAGGTSFRGYGGARLPVSGEKGMEMGPHIVPEEYRKQGYGAMVLAGITQVVLASGSRPYVLGNPANMGNLLRQGFEPAQPGDLADITFDYCRTQCLLNTPSGPCCNDAVILRGEPRLPVPEINVWPAGEMIEMPIRLAPGQ